MYKTIIVPLDGSELAEVALPFAEETVGRTGVAMVLLSVRQAQDPRSPTMMQSYLEKITEQAKIDAEKYQKSPGGQPVDVTWKILQGNPAEEIVSFADQEDGNRIVMATHGQSGFTRWGLGSVADKITKASNVPVTLIRAKGSQPEVRKGFYNNILAPLDGSKESEVILPHVEDMARSWGAEVTFFMVFLAENITVTWEAVKNAESLKSSARNYLENLTSGLKAKGINAKYVMIDSAKDVAEEINKYTIQNSTDLVVMATHGRSGPRLWILGSVTNKVLHEGNTPIMLVRTSRM
jgi:nucleotide-binding universal stress UspA family protein